jgi:glycosyltransferase involved in cell wall biosynthesis
MQEIRPDIVHAMHFQGLSASVIPVFKEFDVPLAYSATDFWSICPVVDLRRHDGVMCEGPDLAHCPRCVASRYPSTRMTAMLDKVPNAVLRIAAVLSETRHSERLHSLRQVRALKERPGRIRERMEQVDHIIVFTRLMRDLLLANGIGEGKIEISPYGIDTSKISKLPRNRNVPPPLRVGFIGTLAPHKGCDILIRAFKSLPPRLEATLTIYGNLERFESFVMELRGLAGGDERINFAGTFQREKMGSVLMELDTLVVPSRWYENAPSVIFAAFAAGVPVVATDLAGMSEFVKHEENGLLFERENVEGLAHQLRRLGEEPGLLERLRAGIGPVKTVKENVDELEDLYSTLLTKGAV